jgi:hypothetical protein
VLGNIIVADSEEDVILRYLFTFDSSMLFINPDTTEIDFESHYYGMHNEYESNFNSKISA